MPQLLDAEADAHEGLQGEEVKQGHSIPAEVLNGCQAEMLIAEVGQRNAREDALEAAVRDLDEASTAEEVAAALEATRQVQIISPDAERPLCS
jgi:hypothetical protein